MSSNVQDASMSRRGLLRTGTAGVAAAAGLAAGSGSAAAAYDGWLDDVDNYDGTHDYRGEDEVHVDVGAGENGLRFGPAAILIDPGTTVVWEWTGEGGAHNVVEDDDGVFDSGDAVDEAGEVFEYTFDDAAEGDTFNYVCTPHEAVGMKGAVAIGDVDDEIVEVEGGADGADRILSPEDIGALALALGFAGALLVPLFYAAHRKAQHDR